jgi:DNA-binding MltR family transcriptional regulator
MADEPKTKTLNELGASRPGIEDIPAMIEEIRQTSDRTAAIVLGSWVERSLEQSIIAALPRRDDDTVERLLGRGGALSNFYGKNQLGYALGLYDETTLKNLEVIRRIRNAFAHAAVQIHFETDQIITEVRKLQTEFTTGTEMGTLSEYRRTYTAVCVGFVVVSRLKTMANRMEMMRVIIDAINPYLDSHKKPPDDLSETLAAAVAAIGKLKDS